MGDDPRELLLEHADWAAVLAAYAAADSIALPPAGGDDSAVGWVSRIGGVDGVLAANLASIHGKLIAVGWLKFQLVGRNTGIVYRLTTEGRRALQALQTGGVEGPVVEDADDLAGREDGADDPLDAAA